MKAVDALERAARANVLLVVCDYDGTIAPLVDDPAAARPEAGAIASLVTLAEMPATVAAILSGRSLDALATLTGSPPGVHLIGSHGAEMTSAAGEPPPESLITARGRFEQLAAQYPGSLVEIKPMGVAFHYRGVPADSQATAGVAAESAAAAFTDLRMIHGKHVVEVMIEASGKGEAIRDLRRRWGADIVVFFGDDVTDEDGFAVLHAADVGVKVGSGPTRAQLRVADTTTVTELLENLAAARSGP
jgi:trehalose 6-phosphate phosphatase